MRTKSSLLRAGVLLAAAVLLTPRAFADETATLPPESAVDPEDAYFSSGDYQYTILKSREDETVQAACIEAYTGSETEVVIPGEIDGLEVIALGDSAFAGNYTLKEVTLPASLEALGEFAFSECTALERFLVESPDSYFESRDGVLYADEGRYLARWPIASKPETVVVPEEVTAIGSTCFGYCKTLTSVTLPANLTSLGQAAFTDCTGLTEITVPQGVTEIPTYCFFRCSQLATVRLEGEVTKIGDAAFAVTALSEFEIPQSCVSVGQAAFAATKMKEITIPETLTGIGYSAFGYQIDSQNNLIADKEFVIHGKVGSEAQNYASDKESGNNFKFIAEGKMTTAAADETGTDTTAQTTTQQAFSTGRIVGIAASFALAGVILILGIIALVRDKKKKREDSKKERG